MGLIWAKAPSSAMTPGDHEQEAGGLGHEDREHRRADHVVLGSALAGELGVLLAHQQPEVRADQADHDQRHDQDVEDEEARDDRSVPGKLPPKSQKAR
jgi:hypothetical protein